MVKMMMNVLAVKVKQEHAIPNIVLSGLLGLVGQPVLKHVGVEVKHVQENVVGGVPLIVVEAVQRLKPVTPKLVLYGLHGQVGHHVLKHVEVVANPVQENVAGEAQNIVVEAVLRLKPVTPELVLSGLLGQVGQHVPKHVRVELNHVQENAAGGIHLIVKLEVVQSQESATLDLVRHGIVGQVGHHVQGPVEEEAKGGQGLAVGEVHLIAKLAEVMNIEHAMKAVALKVIMKNKAFF